jgi:hypothetical protein
MAGGELVVSNAPPPAAPEDEGSAEFVVEHETLQHSYQTEAIYDLLTHDADPGSALQPWEHRLAPALDTVTAADDYAPVVEVPEDLEPLETHLRAVAEEERDSTDLHSDAASEVVSCGGNDDEQSEDEGNGWLQGCLENRDPKVPWMTCTEQEQHWNSMTVTVTVNNPFTSPTWGCSILPSWQI